jgi:soluble lytic murein transglycosylase
MYIARSYRKKENFLETNKWYSKHVQMFPSHSKTQEIFWLQAWQYEDRKKFSSAGTIYKKLYTKFTSGNRRDESYLRHALCYYRQEKYDSSLIVLSTLLKKYPTTSFFSAATFWKAKNLLSIEKYPEAMKCFHDVINYDPLEYYSFRSRYNLSLMGDSVNIVIDSQTDFRRTYTWFDSITPAQQRASLTSVDSLNYRRGMLCASLGLLELAEPFLSNIEKKSGLDLALQYEIALLYSLCNAPAQAYRIARRFAWRIPQESRKNAPLPAFMLLYPAFFSTAIFDEAKKQNVDPNLVSAVIRQESIFDPKIVSPAGAIGLMQIMPYTGVVLAKQLDTPFETDSLYNPLYNVKLGTFYLKDLLKDFNDNLVLVLSSYNAGPHNAKKWYQKNKKEEFDLFIEDIEFTETRGYVKKVIANYWTYRELSRIPAYLENYTPRVHRE